MTLRVKLEIIPWGDEDNAYEIGRLDVFNMGPLPWNYCEYGVIQLDKDDVGRFDETVVHRRHLGAWALVRRVLNDLPIEGPKP